jgi:prolyl-tRNA editing enzyme YbaK/EbsC (Cys-tRNA(Pro) deacylase)
MGFSLDSSTDTTVVHGSSINAQVTAAAGEHTLHVKAWGDKGDSCVTDVAITIAGDTPGSSASGVSVSSPANGASIASPFTLSAAAATCSSQSVSAMGYSLDSSANTTVVDSKSLNVQVTAAAGTHTLHVKSWGDQGASCDTNLTITVGSAGGGSSGSSSGVTVSSPANDASVTSPFVLSAKAATCSSQSVSAMGYSLDSSSNTAVVDSDSVSASITVAAGAHTLHVKAWGNQGAACDTNVAITVGGGGGTDTPLAPSDAISVSSIQTMSNWAAIHDTGGPGSSSGTMSIVSSPSLSGHARKFVTKYSSAGDERYSVTFGDDTSSTNFLYDGWVYIASPSNDIANLEMDTNQVMPNGQTVIFGFQCDGYSGTWDYSENQGSPTKPSVHWVTSKATCNVRNWSTNTWHHVQVSYSRNSSGLVTYKAVWLDGVEQEVNVTVLSAFALGWGPTLSTNFQVDGLGSSGSSTVYLDDLTVYRW